MTGARYPEGHPELVNARETLFCEARFAARYGRDPHQWRHDPELAHCFEVVSERDVRAIEAFAWRHQ